MSRARAGQGGVERGNINSPEAKSKHYNHWQLFYLHGKEKLISIQNTEKDFGMKESSPSKTSSPVKEEIWLDSWPWYPTKCPNADGKM